jgi:bifunctional UDP-N-acetylglucosamine pyrophosphorylase / glucosamine-1-phosphate N-acetyltransferase
VPLSVVVLAAGQGKRMQSDIPKVLQPLAGRPLLAHVLDTARTLAPAAVHVVDGHGGEQVRAAFGAADIHWCRQAEQRGTGHAVAQALPGIPDDHSVLVLCGDAPLIRASSLQALLARPNGLALLTAIAANPAGYGRIVRHDGRVVRIVEEREANEAELAIREINSGILCAPAGDLRRWVERLGCDNAQQEHYLTDVVAMAFADGVDVTGVPVADPDEALGINDKVQLATAERSFQKNAASALMLRGVTVADPGRLDIRGKVTVGRDVFIDVGVVLVGDVDLGDRVRIGPNCIVIDSRLGADSVVHANSILHGSSVSPGCSVGPFARLRPGTELGSQVRIGNFVEVKNSRIAADSKANHLSYIGDSTIGTGVNFGAGTITCNYDGANKHRTTIGDDAFIGSGVMLVAPVDIGSGATIGAGSTISKEAPPAALTVARARQTTVPGWRRPTKKPRDHG